MNPQPHRSSTHCNIHPQEHFTGFCPSCLYERLTVLDPTSNSSSASSSSLKKPFFPELRRTKSFSASKNDTLSSAFQPQRKSCDVRARTSLFFNNDKKTLKNDDEHENPEENVAEDDEIRVSEEPNVNSIEGGGGGELKTMKDHIDLNSSQSKKASKDLKGSLWSKLQKWRQKQKTKKHHQNDDVSAALPVEKPMSRQFRETQSEIADYGFGRRSCDTDPRFSLDIGRVSFDDPRYSLDEPRASWDGYLIGGRTTSTTMFPRMPTMLSVVEDAPVNMNVNVLRTDSQIPVEDESDHDSNVPGGSAQTREYYSDSFSRRRKSLDRSNSIRKSPASVDELKCGGIVDNNITNKVNHASVDSMIRGTKTGSFVDGDLRDDCCSETIELGFRDNGSSVIENGDRKGSKKSRLRWSKAWSIWGFIKGGNKDEGRDTRGNGVDRSFSESWQEFRGDDGNGGGFNGRLLRSNSSVSWRNAQSLGGGSFGTLGSNGTIKGNGHGKKGKDEFVLERNKSARYSPNNVDNGLLRFYLTPMRGSRRNGSVKSKSNQAKCA